MQTSYCNSDINVIGLGVDEVNSENLFQTLGSKDIVHLHWIHPFISNDKRMNDFCDLMRLVKMKKEVSIVWTVHNTVSHECNQKEEELRRRKYASQFFDRLIVHSNYAALEVEKLYELEPSKIFVIPHGKYQVDVQRAYKLINKRSSIRKKMRLTLIGELRAYKNVEYAVDFVSRLNADISPENFIELRIAGRCVSESQLEYLQNNASIKNFISLNLKRLSDEELFEEFCSADFIFAPYSNSLTSGICINAISHGRPFIAPNFKSLLELHSESNSILYGNEGELWRQLLRCNDLFHRGLLSLSFNPQKIIGESAHLEWSNIFSSLDRDPFDMNSL